MRVEHRTGLRVLCFSSVAAVAPDLLLQREGYANLSRGRLQLSTDGPYHITLFMNRTCGDVLAEGTPADVKRSVTEILNALDDKSRLIGSCGGGMPQCSYGEYLRGSWRQW